MTFFQLKQNMNNTMPEYVAESLNEGFGFGKTVMGSDSTRWIPNILETLKLNDRLREFLPVFQQVARDSYPGAVLIIQKYPKYAPDFGLQAGGNRPAHLQAGGNQLDQRLPAANVRTTVKTQANKIDPEYSHFASYAQQEAYKTPDMITAWLKDVKATVEAFPLYLVLRGLIPSSDQQDFLKAAQHSILAEVILLALHDDVTSIRRYRIPELDVSSVKHTYTNAVKQCDLPTLFGGQSVANFCKHIANNYDIRLALAGLPQNYGRSEDLIANPSLVFTWATDRHRTTDVYTLIVNYMDSNPQQSDSSFNWGLVFFSLARWMECYSDYCSCIGLAKKTRWL